MKKISDYIENLTLCFRIIIQEDKINFFYKGNIFGYCSNNINKYDLYNEVAY